MDTDIESLTKDLQSLTFDRTVDVCYEDLTYLRKRSHANTLHLIAHASYFVAILNEIRRKIDRESSGDNDMITKGFDAYNSYNRLKIGFIGCGRLGNHLLNALLTFSNVDLSDVIISTCRPELLPDDIKSGGAFCCWDNIRAAETSEFLFLCMPPAQAEEVFQEIRGHTKAFVYSFVTGFSAPKVSLEIESVNIFKPVYSYCSKEDTVETEYDFQHGVIDTLPLLDFRKSSCPLRAKSTKALVKISTNFLEVLFHECINSCLIFFSQEESFKIVKDVIFPNTSENNELCSAIYQQAFIKNGRFNILDVQTGENELIAIFKDPSHELFKATRTRYKSVFDRFYDWRNPKCQTLT